MVVRCSDRVPVHGERLSGFLLSLPGCIAFECTQEVDLSEPWPVRLAEIELGMRCLPEQEIRQALLAARADHQVRIRAILRSLTVTAVALCSHELEGPHPVPADPFCSFLDGVSVFQAE